MRFRALVALLVTVAGVSITAPLSAQPLEKLFINTGPDPFQKYQILRYDGRDWQGMTAQLRAAFSITTGAALPTLAALQNYDALWVDQRYGVSPTASDLATLLGFAATGRRVVIIGENATLFDLRFLQWSGPIIEALGGTQPSGYARCPYGVVKTVLANSLTAGVKSAGVGCAGYAVGGTPLFDYNVATLWGPTLNVLTMLDANMVDDFYPTYGDGLQYQKNVVSWLGADVGSALGAAGIVTPEPATMALMLPALLGLLSLARRRSGRLEQ